MLIVVAIIGILAAIAVPNFLNAQTKAKVAKVVSELRALSTAAEMYASDCGQFPPHREQETCTELPYHVRYSFFTTPIAYISGIPGHEIFSPIRVPDNTEQWNIADTYYYTWTNFMSYACRSKPHALWPYRYTHSFLLRSRGPDSLLESDPVRNLHFIEEDIASQDPFIYDSTNGLFSRGDVIRTRKEYN